MTMTWSEPGVGTIARQLSRFHWAVLIFSLLNLAFFTSIQSHLTVGDQLIENAGFTRKLASWKIAGDKRSVTVHEGTLRIDHPGVKTSTMVSQCHPAEAFPDTLMLSVEAMSRAVVRGFKPWHEAQVSLVGKNVRGEGIYQVKSRLLGMDGNQKWRTFSGVFHKSASADEVCVVVALYFSSGSFDVRQLALYRAVDNPLYLFGFYFLLLGWIVIGVWLARALFEHYSVRPQGRYLLLLLPLLLGGILMPETVRQTIEQRLLPLFSGFGLHLKSVEAVGSQDHWALWPAHWDLSKLSHLTGFMLLALILFSERGISISRGISALLLLAVATELMQFFVPLRTPRLSDVIVDSSGAGLGLLLSLVVGMWFWRRTVKQRE
jgi:hypothetical protein